MAADPETAGRWAFCSRAMTPHTTRSGLKNEFETTRMICTWESFMFACEFYGVGDLPVRTSRAAVREELERWVFVALHAANEGMMGGGILPTTEEDLELLAAERAARIEENRRMEAERLAAEAAARGSG